ncbi:hypothetical protein LSTR_LSTR012692 [Laodelphax striatellus]|uniref:Importin N-terminal domain-containing protein n=1 Tax=Laodelphax striatellus TaxID=195883 RepID=A0A482XBN1_LAOST|nr:hypothetical protein LSTR_LSTR012692 [Laodelphax striatellus]
MDERDCTWSVEDPEVISSLCNVLVSSSNPQVRQYAAVLLRKRLSKSQHWTRLSAEAKTGIKEGLIQVLVKEQEKVVKNAIVQLIGTIMKLESCKLGWPEMMECLKMWINSSAIEEKGAIYTCPYVQSNVSVKKVACIVATPAAYMPLRLPLRRSYRTEA